MTPPVLSPAPVQPKSVAKVAKEPMKEASNIQDSDWIPGIGAAPLFINVLPTGEYNEISHVLRKSHIDKKLFTPGPLTTSYYVKAKMRRDYGSRDIDFITTVRYIREKLLEIAGCYDDEYTVIPLQGSGTFAVEAVFHNIIGKAAANKRALILTNGAYGRRMVQMCKVSGYSAKVLSFPESVPMELKLIKEHLASNGPLYDLIAMVHSETSSGALNPIDDVSELVQRYAPEAYFFIDAMSSFGAIPVSLPGTRIHFMVSSANKCLEGVPGFSFIIAQKAALKATKDNCPVLSFDLYAQWENLEKCGQFRFTPATHTMTAFKQALYEYDAEGGLEGRRARYKKNFNIINAGMRELGFKPLLPTSMQCYIITSFHFPNDDNFNFEVFYKSLSQLGYVIYPGKATEADCFRIGNIGHIFPEDCKNLVFAIRDVLEKMNVNIPIEY